MKHNILPGFGGGAPAPAPLAPLPTQEDPAIAEAKKNQRKSELRRKGRRASILTSGSGVEDELGSVARPEARAARMLGE
jgi:hypothetical protein